MTIELESNDLSALSDFIDFLADARENTGVSISETGMLFSGDKTLGYLTRIWGDGRESEDWVYGVSTKPGGLDG